jgi:hypothetical protein
VAGRGPAPKPAHLRQRTNHKAGGVTLTARAASRTPTIPNPDRRKWHRLTLIAWQHVWASPMASQWLETDVDALGRVALLWDQYYKTPSDAKVMAEIRLQEQRFGLSPLDRSRLQWEVSPAEPAEPKRPPAPRRTGNDPRKILMMAAPR